MTTPNGEKLKLAIDNKEWTTYDLGWDHELCVHPKLSERASMEMTLAVEFMEEANPRHDMLVAPSSEGANGGATNQE